MREPLKMVSAIVEIVQTNAEYKIFLNVVHDTSI